MANKKTRVSYRGINQDLAKSRVQSDTYFDAKNMKLTPVDGQEFGTISNVKGNVLALTIPKPVIFSSTKQITYNNKVLYYNNTEIDSLKNTSDTQEIIGSVETTDGCILFTTDGELDCVWEVPDLEKDVLDINLLYIRSMGFSKDRPIQAIFNYENELIQKVYWVDGNEYLRFFNIRQSTANGFEEDLIDLPVASVNSKSSVDIKKPSVEDGGGGGIHTAGVIQYGYTMYNLNGAETSLSPLSDLFPLDKGAGNGGGDVNETVGSMPVVVIEDLDLKYNYIKIYSVKYTEYNATPSITLIYDGAIGNHYKFTFNDTGASNLGSIGLAEFAFLGADPIKPSHIEAKDNTLFAFNNKSTAYKFDIDTRAYSYNKQGTSAEIFSNVVYTGIGDIPYTGDKLDVAISGLNVPDNFDCVNLDLDKYRYISNINAGSSSSIVTNAVYTNDVVKEAPIDIENNLSGSEILTFQNACSTTNPGPTIDAIPLESSSNSNGSILIPETGNYYVSYRYTEFRQDFSIPEATIDSVKGFVEIYTDLSLSTLVDKIPMKSFISQGDSAFELLIPVVKNQVIRTVHEVAYSCSGYTPVQDDITYRLFYEGYTVKEVDLMEEEFKLPISAVNGEPVISNGDFISDYNGTINMTINSSVDMKGLGLVDTTKFSIKLKRNGVVISSHQLNLGTTGVVQNTFVANNVNSNIGDTFQLYLVNNRYNNNRQNNYSDQDINLTAYGNFSASRSVNAGSNGEGGTGKYITYELTRSNINEINMSLRVAKFFKDNEVYRIGIAFYNKLGQVSEAKWIADFKAPQGNLEGQFNTLKVSFTPAFYSYIASLPEEDRPTNYVILRAVRNTTDKTIVSQGIMTGMFVQDLTDNEDAVNTDAKKEGKNGGLVKTPIPLTRGYGNGVDTNDSYYPIFPTGHNKTMTNSHNEIDSSRPSGAQNTTSKSADVLIDEIHTARRGDQRRQQAWQYTKMFQMYSPEATFQFPITTTDTDELHLLGYMPRDRWQWWDQSATENVGSPYISYKSPEFTSGNPGTFMDYIPSGFGVIGPAYRIWGDSGFKRSEYTNYVTKEPAKFARRLHVHKTLSNLIRPANELKYEILNKPEITETGQNIKNYNNDRSLQYINKLTIIGSDSKEQDDNNNNATDAPAIEAVNSENNRCLTMVLGDSNQDHKDRVGLDDLYNALNTNQWDVELYGEVRRSKEYIYSGVLYGGYTQSARSRSEYISIGSVNNIYDSTSEIMSPGDTYVQNYVNTRLTKIPGTVYNSRVQVIVETLEYLVETTVNLEERNDSSLRSWDALVDPTAKEGTNYNRVYSTDSVIQKFRPDNLKIKDLDRKETQVIASKTKVPGEFVDNWLDFLPNEVQYLDGKYGPINGVVNHWDQIYTFQDSAVARLSINPRVQTQGNDGVSIEMGSGKVLHDYQYVTTKSGSINKWGIISTNSGIYYLDSLNKQLQRINPRSGVEGVSEAKGLHSYLQNIIDKTAMSTDNPVLLEGVSVGYDTVNGDIYTSVLNGDNSFNVSFNEKMNAYTSFYSFLPSRYITKGDRMFSVPGGNDTIWLHNKGNYQEFYGNKEEASITLMINTDIPGVEKVFDGIEFDSEVTLDDVDVANSTIDSIEAWNTYQKSGKIPLDVTSNVKRKFRTWRAFIPREEGTRNRMRDKWIFLKLGYNPSENNKLILHDIIVNYTV